MNSLSHWLGPILCLIHLLSTPLFFTKTKDFALFLAVYVLWTAGIVASIFFSLNLWPNDLGHGGFAYLYSLAIPVVITGPLVVLVRTIYHLARLARQKQEKARRVTNPYARPGSSSSELYYSVPPGLSAENDSRPGVILMVGGENRSKSPRPGRLTSGVHGFVDIPPSCKTKGQGRSFPKLAAPALAVGPPAPDFSPARPQATRLTAGPVTDPNEPGSLLLQAIKENLRIVAFSFVLVKTVLFAALVADTIRTAAIPASQDVLSLLRPMILAPAGKMLIGVITLECIWQFWTRRVSSTGSVMVSRPIRYHALALALMVSVMAIDLALKPLFGVL